VRIDTSRETIEFLHVTAAQIANVAFEVFSPEADRDSGLPLDVGSREGRQASGGNARDAPPTLPQLWLDPQHLP